MSNKAYDQFSFELRQFRLANNISRAGLASILGISGSTLKQWEDGTTRPRTFKLWEVHDRVSFAEGQDKSRKYEFRMLVAVFEELFDKLSLANVGKNDQRERNVQKNLSKGILRAAQTDFGLSEKKDRIVPVPFTEDLELFRNPRLVDIEHLLQSIVKNVEDTIPHVQQANVNSERLVETFKTYVDEAQRDNPNPRILHRKGTILRSQLQNQDTRSALSSWDIEALDGFVADHQELMMLYFGEALHANQEVERAKIDDRIVPIAGDLVKGAVAAISDYEANRSLGDISLDRRISAILVEIGSEIEDYQSSFRSSNTPASIDENKTKIKTSIKHVGIFVARMIYRVVSFGGSVVVSSGGLIAWMEKVSPGSFKKIYETIRLSFLALLPLP